MVEPAGDQSHAARPNITPRQELANLRAKVCETRARLIEKKNTGLNWQSAILGRPRDSAGDEVCVSRGGAPAARSVRPGRRLQKVSADPYLYSYKFYPTFPHSPHSAPRGRVEGARLGFGTARVPLSARVALAVLVDARAARVGVRAGLAHPSRARHRPTWAGVRDGIRGFRGKGLGGWARTLPGDAGPPGQG